MSTIQAIVSQRTDDRLGFIVGKCLDGLLMATGHFFGGQSIR